jgi:hypothetical protein
MNPAELLASLDSGVSSICTCASLISKHSHDCIDMTVDLSDALKVSVYNLPARYLFCPNVGC